MCAEEPAEEADEDLDVREVAVYWDEEHVCTMLLITMAHDFHIRMSEEMRGRLIDGLLDPLGEPPDER